MHTLIELEAESLEAVRVREGFHPRSCLLAPLEPRKRVVRKAARQGLDTTA